MNCYRSVEEPTQNEDYDNYELHHPPCEKTIVSYYDNANFEPNGSNDDYEYTSGNSGTFYGGEIGSIL